MIAITLIKYSDSFAQALNNKQQKAAISIEVVMAIALAVIGTLAVMQILPLSCSTLPIAISGGVWAGSSLIFIGIINRKCGQKLQQETKNTTRKSSVSAQANASAAAAPALAQANASAAAARPKKPIKITLVVFPTSAPTTEVKPRAPKKAPKPPLPITQMPEIAITTEDDEKSRLQKYITAANQYIDAIPDQHVSAIKTTKGFLKEGFTNVSKEQIPTDYKVYFAKSMLEGLPYLLGEKIQTYSEFPVVGILNYANNNCFFNSDIQALVHSRSADYMIFRGILTTPTKSPQEEISRNTRYILRLIIKDMRQGKAPDVHRMRDLGVQCFGKNYGQEFDSGLLLVQAGIRPLRKKFLRRKIQDDNALENKPWSVLLYGSGAHLTALIKDKAGKIHWADDSTVSEIKIQDIKDRITTYQPVGLSQPDVNMPPYGALPDEIDSEDD